MSKENPKGLLGVNFTDDEFHLLNGHARKHKMPVREFVEYMVRCYINSMQQQQQGKAR
ncbi:hypothetical protein JFU48_17690 [Pseudomonas sp. TH49]|uniref:hypothetical protein n=1 Tax=Pseudomonas sp. TH49 TaxID=2796413 RepID=UPI0019126F9B|nr:hypothetical protein [Pseudomonas sp. TH49]MBK5343203.1 hypothetical protein [Pseudomonas sp. TH49]